MKNFLSISTEAICPSWHSQTVRSIELVAITIVLVASSFRAHGSEAFQYPPEINLSPFQPDLTPGYVLVEGDIQIPYDEYLRRTSGLLVAASDFGPATKWPANIVPFDFVTTGTGAVSTDQQTAAISAMSVISARTGVIFRPAMAADFNRIRFQASDVNSSPIGMQIFGTQIINIFNWNEQIVICHEIYHSLGFHHEQSRTDRDTYVTINEANVCDPFNAFNFWIAPFSEAYGPYDFDSFMHYGRDDFNCPGGGDTITVKAPWNAEWQSRIGNRDHFSYYDTIHCRGRYPVPGDRWLDRAHFGFTSGSFEQPWQHTSLSAAMASMPDGGTLFVKFGNSYNGVGTHSKPVTIVAPVGDVTFGN